MDKATLDDILKKHADWLNDIEGGERADLSYANLRSADLRDNEMTTDLDRIVSVDAQNADELQPQEDESTYNDWEYDLIEYDQQEDY